MKQRPSRLLPVVLALSACLLSLPALAADPAAPPPAAASTDVRADVRAKAIAQTLDLLRQQLRQHGGDWDAWTASLQPFRDDLQRIRSDTPWPWPAKHQFQFQGKEVTLLLEPHLAARPEGQNPLAAIVQVHEQLRDRGIDLIVMPIPDKLIVYPDYLSQATPPDRLVDLPVRRLMVELLERGVEVVDLATIYHAFRREHGDDPPLYYVTDAHWRNLATQLAADELARRLARYDFVAASLRADNPYLAQPHRRTDGSKADDIQLILDQRTGQSYRDADDAPVLLTGDSFSMYNLNPKAMANVTAQVAFRIRQPLALLCREGLAGDMPVELARRDRQNRELSRRRVVIWTFCTRMFVASRWPVVDLASPSASPAASPAVPPPAGAAAGDASFLAQGTLVGVSPPPRADAPYPDYIMKLHVAGLTDAKGQPLGQGQAIIRVLAMKQRSLLPPAALTAGASVRLTLTSWDGVAAQFESIMTGSLDNVRAEIDHPQYWARQIQVVTPP